MTDYRYFDTGVIKLKLINNSQFSIPTYQRPYVWGQIEISKLLTDLYKTFSSNPPPPYFIGTIITKEDNCNADLIDGQQRFTTLWLVAFVFKKMNIQTELVRFLEDQNMRLRLGFEIRKEVELYLTQLLGHSKEGLEISSYEIENLPYLRNVAEGLATIENIIQQFDRTKLGGFGDYIYNMVFMVKNKTPENLDLNHLFATINSAGIQLEQTDIVKSNLLKIIEDEKVTYSKIWEVCQNMNNFFERNARAVFNASDWNAIDLSKYNAFDPDVFKYKSDLDLINRQDEFSIETILNNNKSPYIPIKENRKDEDNRNSEEVNCRSIINFGQLLLHTYRLHLREKELPDFSGTFHVNRLIEIFKELEDRKDKAEIKSFFRKLWDVRFLFDKYVIKWISDLEDKTEHLELVNYTKNSESYYSRSNFERSSSSMLQSVLYFTGDYYRQYWLTPYLHFVLRNRDLSANGDQVLTSLERIDNQLSLCEDLTDKDASFMLLDKDLNCSFNILRYLDSNKGLSFQHYWFYKLEYILWKQWENKSDPKFKNYRISSRNSVEHIYPQHPKISVPLSDDLLHNFGNLVLLSVSQNSEYSYKEVNVKQREFENKQLTYDTLKSFYIFCYDCWNKENILRHKDEMIGMITAHYDSKQNL